MAAVLVITLFFSSVFIAEEMGHHDCTGEDCPICATIELCISIIRTCEAVTVMASALVIMAAPLITTTAIYDAETVTFSLIDNKVRLDY